MTWLNALELDSDRRCVLGSPSLLREQIAKAADLRIYTQFRHNEHLDTSSKNPEFVDEVSEFATTYLIDRSWVAGVITTRMPISPPEGFGPRASMSFFLYNEDGSQAIARPYLDQNPPMGEKGAHPPLNYPDMPKYKESSRWDDQTNAPSSNFIYEFDKFRFFTNASWQERFSHDAEGKVLSGSLDALIEAFSTGHEIKVGISGLCTSFEGADLSNEIFVRCGSGYYHRESGTFCSGTHATVRIAPAIPMVYTSESWDFGWLLVRTDGFVQYWRCNPYTLQFEKMNFRLSIRWFTK